jgi:stage V sporulation protein B
MLIPRRLQAAGMSLDGATATYGQFVGITEVLLFSPGMVTIALATALIPAVSDAMAQDKYYLVRSRVEEAVRITFMIGLPVAAIFLVIPRELCQVLFGYGSAGEALFIMALSGPFLYLQQATTGILQGLGKAGVPFKNLLQASIIKILGIYYLTAVPGINIRGTALSVGAMYIIMSLLNYMDLKKITGLKIDRTLCLYKPALASAAMALLMVQLKMFLASAGLPGSVCLALALLSGMFSYSFILYIIGGINASDIRKVKLLIKRP